MIKSSLELKISFKINHKFNEAQFPSGDTLSNLSETRIQFIFLDPKLFTKCRDMICQVNHSI